MQKQNEENWVALDTNAPIWHNFYTVAPLVVVGTKEGDAYDFAPKHMVTPLGLDNFFGFVCTPKHSTYHNVKKEKAFSVSFVKPSNIIMTSLAATPRCDIDSGAKPIVNILPAIKSKKIDALCLEDSYLILECELEKIIDGFGDFSLITGKIIAAQLQKDAMRVSDGDDAELINNSPILAYIANGRFAEINNTKAFPYPKNFQH